MSKIGIGSTVRIVDPSVFERCGYPMSLEHAIRQVEENASVTQHLDALLSVVHTRPRSSLLLPTGPLNVDRDAIVRVLARRHLRQCRYGGSERSIHTTQNESLRNKTAAVVGIRRVRTGTYSAERRSNSGYWGDLETEPPKLVNQKSHTILSVVVCGTFEHVEIERTRVELHDEGLDKCLP